MSRGATKRGWQAAARWFSKNEDLVGVVVGVGFCVAIWGSSADWDRIWGLFSSVWLQLLAVPTTFALGFLLFWLRDTKPRIYGLLEIAVAETSVWLAVSSTNASNLERGLKFAAGLYLLVRGFENWKHGPERVARNKEAAEKARLEREAVETLVPGFAEVARK